MLKKVDLSSSSKRFKTEEESMLYLQQSTLNKVNNVSDFKVVI